MSNQAEIHGVNQGYLADLYEQYQDHPEELDAVTRAFFEVWNPSELNGHATAPSVADATDLGKVFGAIRFARSIRKFGHLAAQLDPLGFEPPGDPELQPATHRITYDDLRDLPAFLIGSPVAEGSSNALEAIRKLEDIYTRSIGFDNDHLQIPDERRWLREAFESRRYRFEPDSDEAIALLDRLTQVETFELFLQKSFPTKYRFSIEGLDMMIPILDEIIYSAAQKDTSTIAIGMAHRGRLNVLAHIMDKPYQEILIDFVDPEDETAIGWTIGDVKYHKGETRTVELAHGDYSLQIKLPPNPSHLEFINPVAVGMNRAAGTKAHHPGKPIFDETQTMDIQIHGDAAFAGQGIVAETLNLSKLPGYWTGGTVHIIANNQLGFTTLPEHGRSTLYASDLARGFQIPVLHVNADDPIACIEAARIAFAYQAKFEKDFLIDLIGYRRYGHNELDEPGFTQPKLYEVIRKHPTVRQLWAGKLTEQGAIDETEAQKLIDKYDNMLQTELDNVEPPEEQEVKKPEPGVARQTKTAVTKKRLTDLNDGLRSTLDDFNFYSSRFKKTILSRRDDFGEKPIDWATAEELAFASILEDGIPIRMTGQDTARGTFSHRHAILHDAETNETLIPLQLLPQAKAAFEIHNSPLSEAAVLAFEYGYNVQKPNQLVLWEAQYGDFANGAQTIIDEFVLSAREKWELTPSLVMLLPHGYEGAGPDHSSARPERFLQMGAKLNMRMANCTTAAQYFHLLRRQALLLETDPLPLVVLTPKSLLRKPEVASTVDDLVNGKWQPIIDDPSVKADKVERLIFCSGKFYYDLVESEYRPEFENVAIARVEQLYPFPVPDFEETIGRYPNLKQIVWAQEEPKNMGYYDFMSYRLKKLVGFDIPVNYVGRRRSSSPAEGSKTVHQINQSIVIENAFKYKWDYALEHEKSQQG